MPQPVEHDHAREADRRPGSPKVIGVLSIIFASLVLLFSLLSGMQSLAGQSGLMTPKGAGMAEAYTRFYEATRPAAIGQMFVFIGTSAALLFIGVGQLRYRRWSRLLSVYWGVVALLGLGVTTLLGIYVVRPATAALMNEMWKGTSATHAAVGGLLSSLTSSPWMALGSVIVYAPYPVLLIILFTRPAIRRAMDR